MGSRTETRRFSVRIDERKDIRIPSDIECVRPTISATRLTRGRFGFFAIILDQCIDELKILETMFKEEHLCKQIVVYESLAFRFGTGEKEERDRQQYRINQVYTNKHKLQKEVALLCDILTEACDELTHDQTMIEFENAVGALEAMREDDIGLLREESLNYKKMKEMKNKTLSMHTRSSSAVADMDNKIYFLKLECDNVFSELAEEMKYIDKWEASRLEQLHMKMNDQEMEYVHKIRESEKKMENENRCHHEIISFLDFSQEQYKEEIEQWMSKYDNDIETLDSDILKLRIQQQQLIEENEKKRELYAKRIEDMKVWIEYKWNKAVEMWKLKMKVKAAMKIQTWWRETMMRRHLGPYRKKKGKGKGKKDDKKKKK